MKPTNNEIMNFIVFARNKNDLQCAAVKNDLKCDNFYTIYAN